MDDINIIISKYNENLDWIEKSYLSKYCIVYNKGENIDNHVSSFKKVINLNNVGRESHTYLYHIVSSFTNLKNINPEGISVFIQGSIKEHIPDSFNEICYIEKLINEANQHGYSQNAKIYDFGLNSAFENFRQLSYTGINQKDSLLSFGDWFRKYVNPSFQKVIEKDDFPWYKNGIFAVKNKNIFDKHDKSYYNKLLSTISKNRNPEISHYLERSWYMMFCT